MSTKKHLLKDIIQDRKEGMSLSDLSKKYKLAKSTVSLWCQEVILSSRARNIINEKWLKNTAAARAKGVLTNKQRRIDSIQMESLKAQEIIGALSDRDLLIMGVGLYWAEGSKKETGSGFSFINSDPTMVKIMNEWLVKVARVTKDQLIITVSVNVFHKERETEILKFWSNLLDFPVGRFGNSVFIKAPYRKVYDNHENYFGMVRIKVRSSSWLRRRILGMIKVCAEKMPA